MKKGVDSIYKLVEHAALTSTENVPEDVLEKAKVLFLDTMACILGGSSAEGVAELKDVVGFWGGNSQSRVFSYDIFMSAPEAALLNSVMCHGNDFDDTHDQAINHGCVTLVPALIAACEAVHPEKNDGSKDWLPPRIVSGKEFMAALAIGLDVSNRLGMAFIPYLHTGWLPTTLWGPFGSAAACGRVLNLDPERMLNAFGIAYAQIHGNRQALVDGRLAKRIQPAFSAVIGLRSAFYAARRITGAESIIDGVFGIPVLYTKGNFDPDYLREGLGVSYETSNISIKPYPCCRCTHPVIDAAIKLKEKYRIQWEDIDEGMIYLPPNSMGQIGNEFAVRDNPTVDAQFSAQYTASLVFIKGRPRLEDFRKQNVMERRTVADLTKRFKVFEFEKDKSGLVPIKMEIKLKTGMVVSTIIENIKGSRENPLTYEELVFKFNDCLDNSIKNYQEEDREKILRGIDQILQAPDVCDIFKIF